MCFKVPTSFPLPPFLSVLRSICISLQLDQLKLSTVAGLLGCSHHFIIITMETYPIFSCILDILYCTSHFPTTWYFFYSLHQQMFVKILLCRLGNVIGYGDTEVNLVHLKGFCSPLLERGRKKEIGKLYSMLTGLRKGKLSTPEVKVCNLALFLPFCFDWAYCSVLKSVGLHLQTGWVGVWPLRTPHPV